MGGNLSSPVTVSGLPAGGTVVYAVVHVYLSTPDLTKIAQLDMDLGTNGAGHCAAYLQVTGVSGADFGTSCGATTTFDPNSTTFLTSSSAPYVGTFQSFQGSPALDNCFFGDAALFNGPLPMRVFFFGTPADGTTTLNCWSIDIYTQP